MPQSLSRLLIHLVWSTKHRHPYLSSDIRAHVHSRIAEIVRCCGCQAYRVGGVSDHVHIALRLSRTISTADLVREIKTASCKHIKSHYPSLTDFAWQAGYGAFSLDMDQLEVLTRYIDNQEVHHQTDTYQQEYRTLLHKHEVEFDERFVWD